jgi:hypothetical protein
MKKNKKPVEPVFVEDLWKRNLIYIKSVVDVVREPILVLDTYFRVMVANEPFYRMFQVESKDTENKIVYDLGNGQWNIPSLRKLLEDILPKNSFFKGFEVEHTFPFIGHKIMILNARQVHFKDDSIAKLFPPIILLAIEDTTDVMAVAETLAMHVKQVEGTFAERTYRSEVHIGQLKNEINVLKKKLR